MQTWEGKAERLDKRSDLLQNKFISLVHFLTACNQGFVCLRGSQRHIQLSSLPPIHCPFLGTLHSVGPAPPMRESVLGVVKPGLSEQFL